MVTFGHSEKKCDKHVSSKPDLTFQHRHSFSDAILLYYAALINT